MILDDPSMTEQALNTIEQEVEVIYWKVEDALYDGKEEKAKMFFSLLLYIAKYAPSVMSRGLNDSYLQRLKELSYEFYGGCSVKKQPTITIKPPIQERKIPFKKEFQLKDYLVNNKKVLENAFGEKIIIRGTEIEVGDDYKCDIVSESKTYCYPIELKIAQATHAVVSQCSKYCYYFYRTLRYNHFRKIQGVVISNGMDAWSINELRRVGHWIFEIVPCGKKDITLKKID